MNRRALLRLLAASAPAASGIGLWPSRLLAEAQGAGLIAANVCSLMPEVTEGPYYIDPGLVRSDITEGLPGVPMTMRMQVVTADCEPIKGARVDIWHCDAQGNYSGFAAQGSDGTNDTEDQTFLRGTQLSDDQGQVGFQTIYPGWYRGRTTHIHFKVFLDQANVLTGQIFFADALSQYIFDSAPDYARSGERDTFNRTDNIAAEAGDGAYAHVAEQPLGYDAALVIGVSPDAVSTASGHPTGGPPPGPPPGGDGPPDAMRQDRGGESLSDPASLIPPFQS